MKTEVKDFTVDALGGRDSGIRKTIAPLAEGVIREIHDAVPWLHPDHLTYGSNVGTLVGGLLTLRSDQDRKNFFSSPEFSLLVTAGSQLLDGFDGSLARYLDKIKPGSIDFKRGQLMDVGNDRLQEGELAIIRQHAAGKRNDKLGNALAFLAGVTNPVPSLIRAEAETNGVIIEEAGNNAFQFLGTRPGRFLLGTLATIYPKIGEVPVQQLLDGLTIAANVSTSIARLNAIKSTERSPIQTDEMTAAAERAHFLWGLTGVIWWASIATYIDLNRRSSNSALTDNSVEGHSLTREQATEMREKEERRYYKSQLRRIVAEAKQHNIPLVFVGGAVTDFLGWDTTYNIDAKNRTIRLINPNPASPTRDNNTRKDVDAITFTPDRTCYDEFRRALSDFEQEEKSLGMPFASISIEPTRYEGKDWPERNPITQMVTGWNVDKDGNPSFVYGSHHHQIPQKTLEPWTLIVPSEDEEPDLEIPMLNPIGHLLCYDLRTASGFKKKDEEIKTDKDGNQYTKIDLLENLAYETIIAGVFEGEDYMGSEYFDEWFNYAHNLHYTSESLTRFKRVLTRAFWNSSLGKNMSQGVGTFRILDKLKDQFAG